MSMSFSEEPLTVCVREAIDKLDKSTGNAGKASGTRTPRRPTTMPPLMKSCAQASVLCGFPWYLEATKLRIMKAIPPTKIQGNQGAIAGGGDKIAPGIVTNYIYTSPLL